MLSAGGRLGRKTLALRGWVARARAGKRARPQRQMGSEPEQDVSLSQVGVTGVSAGALGSLVGLGGGFVAVPMLTQWVGVGQHIATGTSLAVVLMTGSSGAYGYMKNGNIDYEVAAAIALGGMLFARTGANMMAGTDATVLKYYMGLLQVGVSPLIPAKAYLVRSRGSAADDAQNAAAADDATAKPSFDPVKAGKMFAVGSIAGFLSGMFGVGGGALTVPAIALSTDLPQHAVVGTSLMAMVPAAIVGTATNLSNGKISMRIAGPLGAGSFIGATVGSLLLAPLLPEVAMQGLFSVLMATLGTRTVLQARAALRAAGKL